MRTNLALHVVWAAALSMTVASGAAQARRAPSQALSAAINHTACPGAAPRRMTRAAIFTAEVLLDRLAFSPGVVDGKTGDNMRKAITAFQLSRDLKASGKLDRATWDKICESANAAALTAYTTTDDDIRGPFTPEVRRGDYDAMARLDKLGYRNAAELLAEKFHTTEDMIRLLNPGKNVDRAGTVIDVPNVAGARPAGRVARVDVDKKAGIVRAFGPKGEVVAFYPASVGSTEKPAPSGTLQVRRIVEDPTYHYNPKFQFKGVKTDKDVTIAAGPNNPVGLVWIELSKATYGIHGTARPDEVGKTGSHGCVRMTNWDALDLARRIRKGAPVAFLDETPKVASH